MKAPIGVLGLQGAYQKHVEALSSLGAASRIVRLPAELEGCAGLIIPGGESTTMSLLMQKDGLYDAIRAFAATHPVMGVCAGMILMATNVDDDRVQPLGLVPFRALRNHYGRQVHSFNSAVELAFDSGKPFSAVFIRAPGVSNIGEGVETLASRNGEPVMLRYGSHLAMSFHPELTPDSRIHAYWLRLLENHQV